MVPALFKRDHIMIKLFEQYTAKLTPYETDILVPMVSEYLKTRIGSGMAVRNKDICKRFELQGYQGLREARMRKIVNFIRMKGKVPHLVANSHGYYCATSIKEVEEYCESLRERALAILSIRQALRYELSGKLFIQ